MTATGIFKKLFEGYIKVYLKQILLAVFCMILVALSTAALPYFVKDIFDDVFKNPDTQKIISFSIILMSVFFIKAFAAYGESVLLMYVGQKIISDVQSKLFKHLMTLDLSFFHNSPTGDLISRFTNDVQLMRNAFSVTIVNIGKDTITLIALIALMFYRDVTLACIAFFVFPIAVLPVVKMGRKMGKVVYKTQGQLGHLTTELSQVFQSIRVVKSYHTEAVEQKSVDQYIADIFKISYKAARVRSSASPIIELLSGFAIIMVIAYGGHQISQNEKTTGDFISFIFALLLAYEPLKRLSALNATLQEGLSATRRIFEVFDIKPNVFNAKNPIILNKLESDIVFKSVSFGYLDNKPVLDDLSFTVPFGKSVAFVGPSGSGKSTIINLIPRFYDVLKGEIVIDNIPLQHFDIESLRSQLALVSQEIALFDRSIFENIAYGVQNASMEDVINAAKGALAHDFIINLPEGYQTLVGENGVRLSGGQRQRIAIARAMLKNAPLLLLDEATSALDTDSERQVQEALSHLMKDKTTIMVAHRLSTVVDADIIYVLKEGKIVEQGNHNELLNINGDYARLWAAQLETIN
jgi:subfamily B ATP-binding cassette protein MsbA